MIKNQCKDFIINVSFIIFESHGFNRCMIRTSARILSFTFDLSYLNNIASTVGWSRTSARILSFTFDLSYLNHMTSTVAWSEPVQGFYRSRVIYHIWITWLQPLHDQEPVQGFYRSRVIYHIWITWLKPFHDQNQCKDFIVHVWLIIFAFTRTNRLDYLV